MPRHKILDTIEKDIKKYDDESVLITFENIKEFISEAHLPNMPSDMEIKYANVVSDDDFQFEVRPFLANQFPPDV
jgi:hypothetical protein